jgi:5-methylcytosine-specific restriction endonuclease McrA
MSKTWISTQLRALVEERAGWRCEYCGVLEEHTFFGCQVDHIVSEKHGGVTTEENLAFACTLCNRAKGTDIAGLDPPDGIVPLFHPRLDRWLARLPLFDEV